MWAYDPSSPYGFGGSVTSTLQCEVRAPWHGCAPSCPPSRHPACAGSACFGPLYRDRMELLRGSTRRALSAACAALDHVMAQFSCNTELELLSFFGAKFLSSLNSCSSWCRLLSPLAIDCVGFCRRSEVRSRNPFEVHHC